MFKFSLTTPMRKFVIDVEVTEVVVPGHMGQLDILPGHAPMMTTLSSGVLQFKRNGSDKFEKAAVSWGYCEVNPVGIHILAEKVEVPDEIDQKSAKDEVDRIQNELATNANSMDKVENLQRELRMAQTRLECVAK